MSKRKNKISPEQFTNLTKMMARGVNPRQALREGAVNGIEAAVRLANEQNLSPQETKRQFVRFDRDPANPKKLAIINRGMPMTTDDAEYHLMDLAFSGNEVANDDERAFDPNKGIGIKMTVFPFWRFGLTVRTRGEDPETAFQFQIGTQDDGTYDFYRHYDEEEGMSTPWLAYEKFHPILKDRNGREFSGTEIVFEGDSHDDDTWLKFNTMCVRGRGDKVTPTDTGYPLVKLLENLFWDTPPVSVGVQKYKKGTLKKDGVHPIKGLKYAMQFQTEKKKYWSFPIGDPEDVGIPAGVIAHVTYCPKWEKEDNAGYLSNSLSPGFTAMTYRGEVYHDITEHAQTSLANVRRCGLGGNPGRWIIIFEIPSDCESVMTNLHRTGLHIAGLNNGNLLQACQNAFSLIFEDVAPEIYAKNEESYEFNLEQSVNLDSFARNVCKDPQFKEYKVSMDAYLKGKKVTKTTNTAPRQNGKLFRPPVKHRKGKAFNPFANVREMQSPTLRVTHERDHELGYINFNMTRQYSVDFNPTHPVHMQRAARVKKALNKNSKAQKLFGQTGAASDLEIDQAIMMHVFREVFFRSIEVFMNDNLKTRADKLERLEPSELETCWHFGSVKDIIDICIMQRRDALNKAKKAA